MIYIFLNGYLPTVSTHLGTRSSYGLRDQSDSYLIEPCIPQGFKQAENFEYICYTIYMALLRPEGPTLSFSPQLARGTRLAPLWGQFKLCMELKPHINVMWMCHIHAHDMCASHPYACHMHGHMDMCVDCSSCSAAKVQFGNQFESELNLN